VGDVPEAVESPGVIWAGARVGVPELSQEQLATWSIEAAGIRNNGGVEAGDLRVQAYLGLGGGSATCGIAAGTGAAGAAAAGAGGGAGGGASDQGGRSKDWDGDSDRLGYSLSLSRGNCGLRDGDSLGHGGWLEGHGGWWKGHGEWWKGHGAGARSGCDGADGRALNDSGSRALAVLKDNGQWTSRGRWRGSLEDGAGTGDAGDNGSSATTRAVLEDEGWD